MCQLPNRAQYPPREVPGRRLPDSSQARLRLASRARCGPGDSSYLFAAGFGQENLSKSPHPPVSSNRVKNRRRALRPHGKRIWQNRWLFGAVGLTAMRIRAIKRSPIWRKRVGVEPTKDRLAAPPGFEVRTSHRGRFPSRLRQFGLFIWPAVEQVEPVFVDATQIAAP